MIHGSGMGIDSGITLFLAEIGSESELESRITNSVGIGIHDSCRVKNHENFKFLFIGQNDFSHIVPLIAL